MAGARFSGCPVILGVYPPPWHRLATRAGSYFMLFCPSGMFLLSRLQTLKKLKGKQEENKKREMSRLMSKLDAQDKVTPPVTPASEPVAILDDSINPEDTVR